MHRIARLICVDEDEVKFFAIAFMKLSNESFACPVMMSTTLIQRWIDRMRLPSGFIRNMSLAGFWVPCLQDLYIGMMYKANRSRNLSLKGVRLIVRLLLQTSIAILHISTCASSICRKVDGLKRPTGESRYL